VTPIANPKSQVVNPPEVLPLSLLNDFLYCPRRAALKVVEGWREANVHTERGDIVHEHADLPGYEVAKGVTLLRALPVWSERLGLSGKSDIVEVIPNAEGGTRSAEPQPDATPKSEIRNPKSLRPVEFKLGKRRQWENDDAQLCAQALCLEEMFNVSIPRGAIFHADSKRRREVEFTAELRALTENAIGGLHALLNPQPSTLNPQLPLAVFKPACEECSLYEICLPKATAGDSRAARLARQLFQV
jgi:CRISPR-associated exonuclease Cas4